MTRKEFDVLAYLERTRGKLSQRAIAGGVGVSVGTVNKILASLHAAEWITPDLTLTGKGVGCVTLSLFTRGTRADKDHGMATARQIGRSLQNTGVEFVGCLVRLLLVGS